MTGHTPSPMPRRFVPADFVPTDWPRVEPLYQALLDRPVDSAGDLQRWLEDFSELSSVVSERGARLYIDHTCHTNDSEVEKAYLHWIEHVSPRIKPVYFELQKKFLACPHHASLSAAGVELLTRSWRTSVELFRQENVELETQLAKLSTQVNKINGAMLVDYDGRRQTLQQMARYQEEPDRAVRQKTWELVAERRLQDREAIEAIFDQMLPLRQAIAHHAGLPDYRAYVWETWDRWDYTPEDCHRFAEAVERTCLPVVRQLNEQRRAELGVDRLRPWDLAVDPNHRPPLRPFAAEDDAALLSRSRAVFESLDATFAQQFASLEPGRNLDLVSREGKSPGGYQCSLQESRQPFIFMNAAGLQRDVETMLHEAGHAFHFIESSRIPIMFMRGAPLEFCEVASMSMELLAGDLLTHFYSPDDARRAKRTHLEGVIRLLPWIATIDQFQHWLYTHPGHSRADRADAWLATLARFSDDRVDWGGGEDARRFMWHRQGHLFHSPFYYIEYGIAQLGALQVWMNHRRRGAEALEQLRAAMALGGTAGLPELFATAGARFEFSERTVGPLMQAVGEELAALPA